MWLNLVMYNWQRVRASRKYSTSRWCVVVALNSILGLCKSADFYHLGRDGHFASNILNIFPLLPLFCWLWLVFDPLAPLHKVQSTGSRNKALCWMTPVGLVIRTKEPLLKQMGSVQRPQASFRTTKRTLFVCVSWEHTWKTWNYYCSHFPAWLKRTLCHFPGWKIESVWAIFCAWMTVFHVR